jgi:hypothetical protein
MTVSKEGCCGSDVAHNIPRLRRDRAPGDAMDPDYND